MERGAGARAFYFFYFAAAATLMPFLVLHYRDIGLSESRIGVVFAVYPLVLLVGASLWSGVADATHGHHRVLIAAVIGTIGAVAFLSRRANFGGIILGVIGLGLFLAPVIPLVDNSVMERLGTRSKDYGRIRLWGALGWGLAAPAAGILVQRAGLRWMFPSFLLVMLGCLVLSFRMPVSHSRIGTGFRSGLAGLLRNRSWHFFLVVILLGGAGQAMVFNYLFLYMSDIGTSQTLMGLSLTVATVSELVVFFRSDRLIGRLGVRGLLALALAVTGLRMVGYSMAHSPGAAVALQLLHGLSFSALWVAGVSMARHLAPEGMGATAQGLMGGTFFGLGGAAGGLVGGQLYDHLGPFWMYFIGGSVVLGTAVTYWLVTRRTADPTKP